MKPRAFLDRLRSWFLQGIALVAPLAITIAFLLWLGRSLELFVGGLMRALLPHDWYLPGMGLAVGLLATLAAGLLANLFLVRWLVALAERVLDRIPLVKIAVYLPMSYQLGGYTFYLERDRVTRLEVGAEQALRAVLTGGSLDHPAEGRSSGGREL